MSFWNEFVGSIKTLINSENQEPETDVRWLNVETKFLQLLTLLKSKNEKQPHKNVIPLLSEINLIVEKKNIIVENDIGVFFRLRSILLDIWQLLLSELVILNKSTRKTRGVPPTKKVVTPYSLMDATVMQKTIGNILGRREFDLKYMNIDKRNKKFSELDYRVAKKYRNLLFETQIYLQTSIQQKAEDHITINVNHLLFYGKVLAINSFRIPKVMKLISATISLHEEEFHLISKSLNSSLFSFIDEANPIIDTNKNNTNDTTPDLNAATDSEKRNDQQKEEPHLVQIPLPDDDPSSLSHLIDETPDIEVSTSTLIDELGDNDDQSNNNNEDDVEIQTNGDFKFELNSKNENESENENGGDHTSTIVEDLSSLQLKHVPIADSPNLQRQDFKNNNNNSNNNNNKGGINAADNVNTKETEEEILTKRQIQEAHDFERLCKMIDQYPSLFGWSQFHSILVGRNEDELGEEIKDGVWIQELQKREHLFFAFVESWINHILYVTRSSPHSIDWFSIKGYKQLIPSFIYAMKSTSLENFSKELLDSSKSVLISMPSLINIYIHNLFSMTNAYDIQNTIAAITVVGKWFSHLISYKLHLPKEFDIQYFCKGIDILFHSDHHQIMLGTMSFLYECADVFDGANRATLFVDLLLHKYFYSLFLHWDFSVRNGYQQLLIFKFIRSRRSEVHNTQFSTTLEDATDNLIHGKIQSYLLTVEDRICPSHLLVYADKSLAEYKSYMNLYREWESKDGKKPQKLIPYSLLPKSYKVDPIKQPKML